MTGSQEEMTDGNKMVDSQEDDRQAVRDDIYIGRD
jgi:hypothetical protein